MVCYGCKERADLIHFDHLYVIGSEGCWLCLKCRIIITETLQEMARNTFCKKKAKFMIDKNQLNQYDVVTLKTDNYEPEVMKGEKGTILDIYTSKDGRVRYYVEFDHGHKCELLMLSANSIEKV